MSGAFEQALVGTFLGTTIGLCSGVVPGLHINLLGMIIAQAGRLHELSWLFVSVMIFSAAASQIFSAFLPSILLGAPGSENFLAALPGQKMLIRGMGLRAVFISVAAALLGMLLGVILLAPFTIAAPLLYSLVSPAIPYALLIVSFSMFMREETAKKKIWAFVCFTLSGLAGLFALNSQIRNPLTPMLSGLFGAGMLISSLIQKSSIPPQNKHWMSLPPSIMRNSILSVLSAGMVCLFPAIGPAQAAAVASELSNAEGEDYLAISGGISSANLILSLGTALALGKARNGATALAVIKPDPVLIGVLAACALISASVSAALVLRLSPAILSLIQKANYRNVSIISIFAMLVGSAVFSGVWGVLLFLTSAAIGLLANLLGISRSSLMGCLVVPVVVNYLRFF